MTRAIVPVMERRGGGAIINQTSAAAWVRNGGFYGVFKLAINGLTTNLAMELGDRNIRVNAIAPGPTQTPGLAKVSSEMIDAILSIIRSNASASLPTWRMPRSSCYPTRHHGSPARSYAWTVDR